MGLLYGVTGFQCVALRAFVALPRPVCTMQLLQLHSATIALLLALLEIFMLRLINVVEAFDSSTSLIRLLIFRYLYCCVWKNVGVLNDEFVARFLVACNTILALGYGAVIYATGVLGLSFLVQYKNTNIIANAQASRIGICFI